MFSPPACRRLFTVSCSVFRSVRRSAFCVLRSTILCSFPHVKCNRPGRQDHGATGMPVAPWLARGSPTPVGEHFEVCSYTQTFATTRARSVQQHVLVLLAKRPNFNHKVLPRVPTVRRGFVHSRSRTTTAATAEAGLPALDVPTTSCTINLVTRYVQT